MLLMLFALIAVGDGVIVPKFQVLTPDELMVQVPHYEDKKLVTFRIGVKRLGRDTEDLEFGENDINDDRIFIYDQRLNLQKGDIVNYLLAFRDKEGYHAETGNYQFDGVYYKNANRRHRFRFRRDVASTTDKSAYNNFDETEEFGPSEPRFGGGGFYPHHGQPWPGRHHGFNPWGPPRRHHFPPPPPPDFGNDCNDHRHDRCHSPDTERFISSTGPSIDYYCKKCASLRVVTSTVTSSTSEEDTPDIDIRFAN